MANNISVKDASASTIVLKTTDNTSVHTPHHIVDSSALPAGAATAAKQDTIIGHLDGVEGLLTTIDGDTQTLAGAVSGSEMQVDLVAPIPAGDNNIGNVDVITLPALPAGTNNIGDVDIATMPDSRSSWRVSTVSFTTADDSDHTFTVAANTEYQILSIYVSYVSTATSGDRQLAIHYTDSSDNVIGRLLAGIVQAASLTRTYMWGPGLPQETAFRDTDYIAQAMYPMFLAAGQKIRIFDNNAVDAAADDMTIRMQIASRSIA